MSRRVIDVSVRASGFILLGIGVVLLILTFVTAYGFLKGLLGIQFSGSIMEVFGEALAPLVETSVKAIFLGIMGWIGSILTNRGVQILTSPTGKSGKKAMEGDEHVDEDPLQISESPIEKHNEEDVEEEKD